MKLDWPLFSDLCTVDQCITTEERLAGDVTVMCLLAHSSSDNRELTPTEVQRDHNQVHHMWSH